MGKPLMIQPEDDDLIEELKQKLGSKSKVEVVREGLRLLVSQVERENRIKRWKRATELAQAESAHVNAEFRPDSRLRRT